MLNRLKRYRLVLIFGLITIILIPFSLSKPAETENVAVVTSIGIDKLENEIELSVNVVVPNNGANGGFEGTVKTFSSKGENVSSAFSNLSLIVGKLPGLAHCDSIILNKELFEEDVTKYLDYFVRTNNLTSNAVVIVAKEKAKDIIKTSATQKGIRAITLSDILTLNNEFSLMNTSNVDKFYIDYFSPAKTIILPVLTTGNSDDSQEQDSQNSQSSSSSQNSSNAQSGESGSSSGNGSPEKIIKNFGDAVIVKQGKIVEEINGEVIEGLNLISKETNRGHIKIEDVTTNLFKNANLSFEIFDKKTKVKGYFVNGQPVFNFKFDLVLKLEEVSMEGFKIESMQMTKNFIEGEIKSKINEKVQKEVSSVLNVAKQSESDFVGIYNYFHKFYNNEWSKFLNSLNNKDDYLNYIVFTCNINLQGKI